MVVVVAAAAISLVSVFTGYKGLLRKVMNAYESYDIDALVDLSSDMYYYGHGDFVEYYFENNVGKGLDAFEASVGHSYKLSYEIQEIYTLSDRKLGELLDNVEMTYPNFDVSEISKVVVADVTVTAKQGNKSASRNVSVTMTKEDGSWKLLYLE